MALKSGEVGEMMNCGPLQVLLFDSLIQSCFVKWQLLWFIYGDCMSTLFMQLLHFLSLLASNFLLSCFSVLL